MQREGLRCNGSPDVFIKEFSTTVKLVSELEKVILNPELKYRHWKNVQENSDAQPQKYKWKEVEETASKADYIATVADEHAKLMRHIERVQNQYKELRKLRENLPINEILPLMNFAENYNCSSVEEVQSAH